MSKKQKFVRMFERNTSGSIALVVGLGLPVLVGFTALAVDVGYFQWQKVRTQQAVDLAAVSVLKDMRENHRDWNNYPNVRDSNARYRGPAISHAQVNLSNTTKLNAVKAEDVQFGVWDFDKKTFNDDPNAEHVNAVRISAELSEQRNNAMSTFFAKLFTDKVDLSVETLAILPQPPQFHALSANANSAFRMIDSDIDIGSTLINSSAGNAFDFQSRLAGIGSHQVWVHGDTVGAKGSDKVSTGQPAQADYFKEVPEPNTSGCDYNSYATSGTGAVTLRPGVYCGGLTISGVSSVTMQPGLYVIKSGPFTINSTTASRVVVRGEGVMVYLTGSNAEIKWSNAIVNLRARMTGEQAGVAVFSARGSNAPKQHTFSGTRTFISGTFYAPDSELVIDVATFNGHCGTMCVVADTFDLNRAYLNYYGTNNPSQYGEPTWARPVDPPAMNANYSPYVYVEKK